MSSVKELTSQSYTWETAALAPFKGLITLDENNFTFSNPLILKKLFFVILPFKLKMSKHDWLFSIYLIVASLSSSLLLMMTRTPRLNVDLSPLRSKNAGRSSRGRSRRPPSRGRGSGSSWAGIKSPGRNSCDQFCETILSQVLSDQSKIDGKS